MIKLKKSDNIYREILDCEKQGKKAALVTVINTGGSTPQRPGSKMLILQDGTVINTIGGGAVEKRLIKDARETIKSKNHRVVRYTMEGAKNSHTKMICGGWMEFFIEPLKIKPNMYIFGAGHIGKALYQLGQMSHFHVTVIDDRKEYMDKDFFSDAELVMSSYGKISRQINFRAPAFVVIVTASHATDEVIVKNILKRKIKLGYIGMIGSRKKSAQVKEKLKRMGLNEKLVSSVHSPVGLPINSKEPEEIAVSIMAEIIKVKNSS
ncbi:MAG: XdhC family protein [Spirochaetes bacterium]|nr:XdhC family protein [Spirochaetota bacterium]